MRNACPLLNMLDALLLTFSDFPAGHLQDYSEDSVSKLVLSCTRLCYRSLENLVAELNGAVRGDQEAGERHRQFDWLADVGACT